jgi:hypothetical protein
MLGLPLATVLSVGVASGAAPADAGAVATRRVLTPSPVAGWSVVELRGGLTTHGDAGATFCGQVSPSAVSRKRPAMSGSPSTSAILAK